MDTVAVVTATAKDTTASRTSEYRGPVLEVLHKLLAEGRNESVVALVTKLVARNRELELQLAKLQARGKKNEGVSSEQLKVLFDALEAALALMLGLACSARGSLALTTIVLAPLFWHADARFRFGLGCG